MLIKKRIYVSCQDVILRVYHDDILYCKAHNGYVNIYLVSGKKVLLCRSLRKFNGELNSSKFLRLSQSYLVNSDYINIIDKKNKAIELDNGVRIPFTIKIREVLELIPVEGNNSILNTKD